MISTTSRSLRHSNACKCWVVSRRNRATPHQHRCAATSTGLRAVPWTGSLKEQEALATLRSKLKDYGNGIPNDETLKWYLRDRYFDVAEAEAKLRSMLRWRQSFRPHEVVYEQVERELSVGKGYVHQHLDLYGRPVIVIRAKRHVTGQYPLIDSKRLCVYLIDQAIKMLPEGEEQVVGIFDLRGFGVQNADVDFAMFMVEAFFEYYPRRVAQVHFVEAPWIFQSLYTVIQPLLRKYAALVKFTTVQEIAKEFTSPATVPPDFR